MTRLMMIKMMIVVMYEFIRLMVMMYTSNLVKTLMVRMLKIPQVYQFLLQKNGRLVAIGAHLNDENGNQAGHVRVYKYIKKGGWSQIGGDIDGKSACSQSGLSVSISDKATIAIGAPGSSCSVNDFDSAGYVRVMKLEDSCGAKKISKRKVCTTPSEQPSGQPSKQTKTPKSRRLNN